MTQIATSSRALLAMTIFVMIGNDNKTLLAMTIRVPSLRACRSNLFFTIFYKFLADSGQRAAVNQIDCHLERSSPRNNDFCYDRER